jgi:hypothetical protein
VYIKSMVIKLQISKNKNKFKKSQTRAEKTTK